MRAGLVEAGVASSGTAESFLSASSVTRTRQAHQITACSLYNLMKEAYYDYCSDEPGRSNLNFEDWCEKRRHESPQFQFWNLVLGMELTIFYLIRSFREGNFDLYTEALAEPLPYFFANSNVNYARWLPIHLRDMMSLEQRHPERAREFHKGNFVVHKSERHFSAMAIDQAHEQNNAVIKGDGGAIGLTEDPAALRRWMVAGPDQKVQPPAADTMSRTLVHRNPSSRRWKHIRRYYGRWAPFLEDSVDLLVLDTKNIADQALAEMVGTHHQRGKDQFKSFMGGLQNEDSCLFYNPIKKNQVCFFKHEQAASNSKQKVLKDDCQLFSRLFISCQKRQCDLHEFFKHENQSAPASLSDNGKLHTCQKSQLAEILQTRVNMPDRKPARDAIIIDGSALINDLPPRTSKTFDAYASQEILPKVQSYCTKYKRLDIVFDVYKKSSLKFEVRLKRGQGIRRTVIGTSKTPTNWRSFLRDNTNKTELFNFLAEKMCEKQMPSTVIVTKGDGAISNTKKSLVNVSPCNHEEADTRIFVHARDARVEGSKSLIINANDTDVLVIAVSVLPSLQELGLEKMWIAFGQGASARWIPVHDVVSAIGPKKTSGIRYFHAFTGCDVVSGFRGKGKKSAWQTWT